MTRRNVPGIRNAQPANAAWSDDGQVTPRAEAGSTGHAGPLGYQTAPLFRRAAPAKPDTRPSLRFLGHNCFVIETVDRALIIDPWLSPKGAFFGNWFQHPPNHRLRDDLIALSQVKPCWVYYTHEHTDHFDIETLGLLNRNVRVIVPKFHDNFLFDRVNMLGLVCTELEEGCPLSLGDMTLSVYIADTGGSHDSAILVKTTDFTFMNQNDCKVFDKLASIAVPVDYYSVQYSRANWYPFCHRAYTERQLHKISDKLNQRKVTTVLRALDILQPRYFLPCAGPTVFPFLDEALTLDSHFFMHHAELAPHLPPWQETLYPRPGDMVDPDTSRTPIARPSADDLAAYRTIVTSEWDALPEAFDRAALVAAIEARLTRIADLDLGAVPTVVFRFGEGDQHRIVIDLKRARIIDALPDGDLLEISGDARYFTLMHSGQRWQDINLSLRATIRRLPDRYNEIANIFISSEPDSIRDDMLSVLRIPSDRIVMTCPDGQRYTIDRYCPHQGADLSRAEVTDRHEVVCPRHGWRFNLERGGLIPDGTYCINATTDQAAQVAADGQDRYSQVFP